MREIVIRWDTGQGMVLCEKRKIWQPIFWCMICSEFRGFKHKGAGVWQRAVWRDGRCAESVCCAYEKPEAKCETCGHELPQRRQEDGA